VNERLEEYADGLLAPDEARAVEEAVARDPALAAELERVRRFVSLLDGLAPADPSVARALAGAREHRRTIVRLRFAAAAAAGIVLVAAAFLFGRAGGGAGDGSGDPGLDAAVREARAFGRRLGDIAAIRRDGRVPRIGLSGFETPPAQLFGHVFEAALEPLGVARPGDGPGGLRERVRAHFVTLRATGTDVAGEAERAERALVLYHALERDYGADVAAAFYDVFRPGLADLATARRVEPGALADVVRRVDPDAGARYLTAYAHALRDLRARFGKEDVALVLARLAPDDARAYWRDAAQDGVRPEAVLSIRARLYRAAAAAGVARVYVDPES
jgi:hypothetical protein